MRVSDDQFIAKGDFNNLVIFPESQVDTIVTLE